MDLNENARHAAWRALLMVVALLLPEASSGAEWPQWRGPDRDGVWTETGIVDSFPAGELPLKWRVEIGSGYSGPTVADGRVYVMDRVTEPREIERVHCFDWRTGEKLWTHAYDCPYRVDYPLGPRASVTVADGRAFSLGTMGHARCLDAATGEVVWALDLAETHSIDMPIWGISASPLVFEDIVILHIGGADGACVIGLDVSTGEERWRALDDPASYSSPILIEQAGQPVAVVWTGRNVAGLDPETGEVRWKREFNPSRMVLNVATPVFDANRLIVSAFYDGSMMLKLDPDSFAASQVWRAKGVNERRTESLHSLIVTPILEGDTIYGIDSYGQLRGLEAATGKRLWEDQTVMPEARWATAHMVRNHGKVWMFNELGELIIGRLTPEGFEEADRAKLIEPTGRQAQREGGVCWSHPAFARKHVFARNHGSMVCASLAAD